MRRIAYSPEVRVYIQPNETVIKDGKERLVDPIDISKDIIEGSIERRTNDISTARFVVQGRRLGKENETDTTTSVLLSRKIRPMDRIVVYLKKTKPILVFSGYIDLVPLVQFVPEPVVIEASCSLKRLQYTYWDPTLPNVMQAFLKMGMIVQNNESGFNVFQPPGQDSSGLGQIEDQGFPKLLSFLLVDVGGWNPETVFIEPLPQEWLDTVEPMFRNLIENDNTWDAAKEFLDAWLGSTPPTDDGGGTSGSGTHILVDETKIENYLKSLNAAQWMFEQLPTYYSVGNKYKIDPRFLIAITLLETDKGNYGPAQKKHNPGGLGTSMSFPSWEVGIDSMYSKTFLGKDTKQLYAGKNTVEEIGSVWAPVSDPRNDNANWPKNVKSFMRGLGADPDFPVRGPRYEKLFNSKQNTIRNSASGKGTKDKNTLTVYLEAVGSGKDNDTFLAGYQKLDFFGRGYELQSSQNRMAKNRDVAKRIRDNVNTLIRNFIKSAGPGGNFGASGFNPKLGPFPDDFFKNFDPIDIELVNHSNTTKGWKGDLYLAIDHSDEKRDNDICYCITPKLSSPMLTNPTLPIVGPDYGSGWQKPSSVSGRDSIKDKNLIENSNKFRNVLVKSKKYANAKKNSSGLTISAGSSSLGGSIVAAQRSWKGTIPGFFYTNAQTCVYLQLPNKGDGYSDKQSSGYVKETDDWAWQIAYAIYDYYVTEKLPNKIKNTVVQGANQNSNIGLNGKKSKGIVPNATIGGGPNTGTHSWADLNNWMSCNAIDIFPPKSAPNAPVLAAENGIIDQISPFDSDGRTWGAAVYLKIKNGQRLFYKHLLDVGVKLGEKVVAGQVLGHLGTGVNGGPHLHFGVSDTTGQGPSGPGPNNPSPYKWNKVEYTISGDYVGKGKEIGDGGTYDGGDYDNSDDSDDSQNYQDAINFNRAAFNVAYNFPGSLVDSILLRGKRALQNDVPLLDSVRDITIGSMRNFASLPNGDFIAWFPDYFNIARRNPWLRISPVEIKKCTIDLSDKYLTTHVYIMGNPYGIGNLPSATSEWYEKLQGAGIVTVEQEGILESFLFTKDRINKRNEKEQSEDYDYSNSAINFLEKYGARPLTESNLTLRHPLVEFFYAYHTFITNWAKQFISRVEFTFMPELFPGMIIEIPNYQEENKSFTFYVEEVTHTFSYTGGFSTSAVLIAPGQVSYTNDDPLGLIPVRPPNKAKEPTRYKIAPPAPPKKQTYKEFLNGRKSTEKLAAQWKKLNGLNK